MAIPMKMPPAPDAPRQIEMPLRALLDAQPALVRLVNEKMSGKLAYSIARLIKVIQPEVDEFFTQRNDLVRRYGVTRKATDEERPIHGEDITEVAPEHATEYRREIDELADAVVRINREPLDPEGFASITAADILLLGALIKD